MNNFIHTGLYRLYNPKMDWNVAHLYEHLLIRFFQDLVISKGYAPYLYGWVSGETFQGVIFIEYGFYSSEVEKLFLEFMSRSNRVGLDNLANEITRIEAESKVILDIDNPTVLKESLLELDKTAFVNVSDDKTLVQISSPYAITPSVIKEKRSKKSFKQITVALGFQTTDIEEKAVFLRLTPIIFDAINTKMFDLGLYQDETSWPVRNERHDSMLAHSIYSLRKGTVSNKEILAAAKEALADIDVQNHKQELKAYIDGFVSTPNWNTFPIDYYRHTGLLVSKERIAELFTPDRVQNIINQLRVAATPTNADHFESTK